MVLDFIEILKVIFLGIVEGITEFVRENFCVIKGYRIGL